MRLPSPQPSLSATGRDRTVHAGPTQTVAPSCSSRVRLADKGTWDCCGLAARRFTGVHSTVKVSIRAFVVRPRPSHASLGRRVRALDTTLRPRACHASSEKSKYAAETRSAPGNKGPSLKAGEWHPSFSLGGFVAVVVPVVRGSQRPLSRDLMAERERDRRVSAFVHA